MSENTHAVESERRLVTVMFADIAGFTAMSEKMDPEVITDLMNACFRMMEKIIEEHGGTIDKFIGDCVMALFGAPKALENAPHRAIDTALAMKDRIQRFNMEKDLPVPLGFHIGINTGEVIAGLVGGEKRQDFTVMGDTVNLASRLAGAAATGSILVSESTFRLTEGYFDFQEMEPVSLKGKEQPVKTYAVLGTRRTLTRIHAGACKGLSPFAGRVEEMALLKHRFELAAAGHGQVVGIVGEPGVGKSRLIRQFWESLDPDAHTFIEGGCVHFGDAIPYLPILDLLKDCFAIKEQDDEVSSKSKIQQVIARLVGDLNGITPPLHELLSLKVEDEAYARLDAKERRDRTFAVIRDLLLSESRVWPLVVIIEDLHWIDKTSEELLSTFMPLLADARILLILLYRPEYNPAWAEHAAYTQINLAQLPQATSVELVQRILGSVTVEPELSDFITIRAEGNPLFIEELTWNLLENGSITKAQDRYCLTLKPADIQVPATVQGIIAARLDRLEDNLKKLLQTAAVIGQEFAFRILQAIAAFREDLRSSLLSLQDMEYIYAKTILPELEYIFKHTLTQEVAYNSLLIKKRKEIHARVGQAIEQLYSNRLEEFYEVLAYHYAMSEDSAKACYYLELSGDKAAKGFSNWEAVRFYKEALHVLDAQPASEENSRKKLQVCISNLSILVLLGYPEGTLEMLQICERLAQELGDEKSLVMIYMRLSQYYSLKGNLELAIQYSRQCHALADKIGDIDLMAQMAYELLGAYVMLGYYSQVVDISLRTLQRIEEQHKEQTLYSGVANVYSSLSAWYMLALGVLGEFNQAKLVFAKGIQNAHSVHEQFACGQLEMFFACVLFLEGDPDEIVEHAEKAIQYHEESGAELYFGFDRMFLGAGYALRGDAATAIDHIRKAIHIETLPSLLPWQYLFLAMAYLTAGELVQARDHFAESLRLAGDSNIKGCETLARVLHDIMAVHTGDEHLDDAMPQIEQGFAMLSEGKMKSFIAQGRLYLGEFFLELGRMDEARANLQLARDLYLEMQVTPKSYWLNRTRAALAKLDAST